MTSSVVASGCDSSPSPSLSDASAVAPVIARPSVAETLSAWEREIRQFAALLRDGVPDAAWLDRFAVSSQRQAALAQADPDAALYILLQAAVSDPDAYSAHHSMLCAVAAGLCSHLYGWPETERAALHRAALSMNVSMASLQDVLACQAQKLTPTQRAQVDDHAARSAQLLADAGVTDALWLGTVQAHHGCVGNVQAPAERLAALLQRVDVYTAKLSRRASREPLSPALAARQTCLDEGAGRPDPLGAVLLRAVGVYPPGCCVALANEELGIVIRRGAKAHTPIVAALRRGDGGLFMPPVRRDTAQPRFAIAMGRPARDLNVRVDHLRTLSSG